MENLFHMRCYEGKKLFVKNAQTLDVVTAESALRGQ